MLLVAKVTHSLISSWVWKSEGQVSIPTATERHFVEVQWVLQGEGWGYSNSGKTWSRSSYNCSTSPLGCSLKTPEGLLKGLIQSLSFEEWCSRPGLQLGKQFLTSTLGDPYQANLGNTGSLELTTHKAFYDLAEVSSLFAQTFGFKYHTHMYHLVAWLQAFACGSAPSLQGFLCFKIQFRYPFLVFLSALLLLQTQEQHLSVYLSYWFTCHYPMSRFLYFSSTLYSSIWMQGNLPVLHSCMLHPKVL